MVIPGRVTLIVKSSPFPGTIGRARCRCLRDSSNSSTTMRVQGQCQVTTVTCGRVSKPVRGALTQWGVGSKPTTLTMSAKRENMKRNSSRSEHDLSNWRDILYHGPHRAAQLNRRRTRPRVQPNLPPAKVRFILRNGFLEDVSQ